MLLRPFGPPPAGGTRLSVGSTFVAADEDQPTDSLDAATTAAPAEAATADLADTKTAAAPALAGADDNRPEFDREVFDVAEESDAARRDRFDQAVNEYMQPLYGNALRLTGNPDDASDLVQATFERAFRAFHQYRPGTNLKAWLFKIQNNTFINEYRKKQRQPKVADGEQVEDWQMHRAESHTSAGLRSAEDEVLESLPAQAVRTALAQISDEYRQAVLLADVEGLRYKEIAEIMGTPVGTVMSRLHRGRRQLRELLEGYAREHGYGRQLEGGDEE